MKNTEIIKLLEQNELTEDVSISYFVSDEGNKTISVYFYSSDIELEYDTDNRDVTVHTRSLGKNSRKTISRSNSSFLCNAKHCFRKNQKRGRGI